MRHHCMQPGAPHPRVVACLVLLFVATSATLASAHLEFFTGRLLDLVQRSDRLLVAKVTKVEKAATDAVQTLTVEWSVGDDKLESATVRAHRNLGFATGGTYAFFVTENEDAFDCIQPAGVLFPVADDGREFRELDAALRPLLGGPTAPITAVLIPALRSASRELRYNVAFALRDAAHGDHPLPPAQRTELEKIMAEPSFDDTIRPLLAALITAPHTPEPR